MQVFRVQMCKWQLDVHNLNQFIAELKRTSPAAAASSVIESATELNGRWNKLTLDADEREVGNIHFMSAHHTTCYYHSCDGVRETKMS